MSAIAGIFGQGSLEQVRTMVARLNYRGPLHRVWSPAPDVYLGEAGHEIGDDESDRIAASTPEIRLRGADANRKVLIEGSSRELFSILRSLRSDFSLAGVCEASGGSIVLAVDQMGYRSLYLMRLPNRWIFASDYKALLALEDCPAAVDRDVLQYYLRYGKCLAGESLLAGARRLEPGQVVRLKAENCVIESYIESATMKSVGSQPRSPRVIREKLESIVTRQLDGHARVAVTLSAGFDSTALVALVKHVRPDIDIASYTIGFGPDDPEIQGARRSAEYFKTEHHEALFTNPDLERLLPLYVWLTEDLGGRGEAILQQQIAERVAVRDRIVMAGHTADMIFCGMPRHRLLWIADRSPPPVRLALRELFEYTQIRTVPGTWLARRLVKMAQGEEASEGPKILGARTPEWPERLKTLDGYRSEHWVTDTFRYHDPAVDCNGLTMLSPFADPELRDIALGLAGSSVVNWRQQKKILRESMADLLPKFLLERPKAIQRLRQDDELPKTLIRLAGFLDLDRSLTGRGLIEKNAADTVLRGQRGQYTKTALKDLWGLICAELWMRTFCDRRGEASVKLTNAC